MRDFSGRVCLGRYGVFVFACFSAWVCSPFVLLCGFSLSLCVSLLLLLGPAFSAFWALVFVACGQGALSLLLEQLSGLAFCHPPVSWPRLATDLSGCVVPSQRPASSGADVRLSCACGGAWLGCGSAGMHLPWGACAWPAIRPCGGSSVKTVG